MIRRGFRRTQNEDVTEPVGFDAFELRLGDLMRGERATLGKSLLDVQRELKIKAAYIAAIENADPTAFDTPGFIAGYVRSYARYLNMDPDWAFETFCKESGFATAHGMSEQASGAKPIPAAPQPFEKDIFASSATPFVPSGDRMFSGVEPRAVGSIVVLVALVGGLGWGGWSVLQEVQKVQLAPVENTPTVVADVDPLAGGGLPADDAGIDVVTRFDSPSADALDRLYRPQALDAPVMVPRDGPIATLDPRENGAFVPQGGLDSGFALVSGPDGLPGLDGVAPNTVQVTEAPRPGVQMVAVRPAWVRVSAADGTVIFEAIMNAGDTFDVPQTEEPATLRIGESGAVYFAMNGAHYGPVGPAGQVTSNVALSVQSLADRYSVAELTSDSDLAEVVRFAEVQTIAPAASE